MKQKNLIKKWDDRNQIKKHLLELKDKGYDVDRHLKRIEREEFIDKKEFENTPQIKQIGFGGFLIAVIVLFAAIGLFLYISTESYFLSDNENNSLLNQDKSQFSNNNSGGNNAVEINIKNKEWGYDEIGKVYFVTLDVQNNEPYEGNITIYNVYCITQEGNKQLSISHYADKQVIANKYIMANEKQFYAIGEFDVDEEPLCIEFVLYDGTNFPYKEKETYKIQISTPQSNEDNSNHIEGSWQRDIYEHEIWEFNNEGMLNWANTDFYYKLTNSTLFLWNDEWFNSQGNYDEASWVFNYSFLDNDTLELIVSDTSPFDKGAEITLYRIT